MFEMCTVESLFEVEESEGGLAPGAPEVDASGRGRDTWATSTDGDGFPGFLGSGGGAGGCG